MAVLSLYIKKRLQIILGFFGVNRVQGTLDAVSDIKGMISLWQCGRSGPIKGVDRLESLEVILEDFRKDELDNFISKLKINLAEVKSSHFFDNNSGADIEFHQIKSFRDVLSPIGTGNVFLKQVETGCSIKNVMIVFSFDKELGDITFNFSENELYEGESSDARLNVKNIRNASRSKR